jgi:hypothetical protein
MIEIEPVESRPKFRNPSGVRTLASLPRHSVVALIGDCVSRPMLRQPSHAASAAAAARRWTCCHFHRRASECGPLRLRSVAVRRRHAVSPTTWRMRSDGCQPGIGLCSASKSRVPTVSVHFRRNDFHN